MVKSNDHGPPTEDDIIKAVASSGLEEFKHLRGGVVFAPTLPRNTIGKIMRRKLFDTFNEITGSKEA